MSYNVYLYQVCRAGHAKWDSGGDYSHLTVFNIAVLLCRINSMLEEIVSVVLLTYKKRLNSP